VVEHPFLRSGCKYIHRAGGVEKKSKVISHWVSGYSGQALWLECRIQIGLYLNNKEEKVLEKTSINL
jgi:hypothetical protein